MQARTCENTRARGPSSSAHPAAASPRSGSGGGGSGGSNDVVTGGGPIRPRPTHRRLWGLAPAPPRRTPWSSPAHAARPAAAWCPAAAPARTAPWRRTRGFTAELGKRSRGGSHPLLPQHWQRPPADPAELRHGCGRCKHEMRSTRRRWDGQRRHRLLGSRAAVAQQRAQRRRRRWRRAAHRAGRERGDAGGVSNRSAYGRQHNSAAVTLYDGCCRWGQTATGTPSPQVRVERARHQPCAPPAGL